MSGVFEDRDRAESFGAEAERYDRTRPGYPPALVEWLSRDGTGSAVDVGCGTGLLTRALVDAGWAVTGVEADPLMAEVARTHGLEVEVSTFEDWPGHPGAFDLVCSAQAWHWVDPTIGFPKAASLLRTGGHLALVWNSYHHSEPVREVLVDVIGRIAPDVLEHSVQFGTAMLDHEAEDELVRHHLGDAFDQMTVTTFEHERRQSVDEWTEECLTHSPIALLPRQTRERLLTEQHRALTQAIGDTMTVRYVTRATTARRV